jgi:F0F1-type ATP synthase membrane subunit b/b'
MNVVVAFLLILLLFFKKNLKNILEKKRKSIFGAE